MTGTKGFHLDRMNIGGFRNLERMKLKLEADMTVLTGDHGSGKTAAILGLLEGMSAWTSQWFRTGGAKTDAPWETRTRESGELKRGAIKISWGAKLDGKDIRWRWKDAGRDDPKDGYMAGQVEKARIERMDRRKRPVLVVWLPENRRGGPAEGDGVNTLTRLAADFEGEQLDLVLALIARADPRIADAWQDGTKSRWIPCFEYETGEVLRADELSYGEQRWLEVLANIASIIAWQHQASGLAGFEQAVGLALIDQLELNLSPERQELALTVLRDAFPKLQLVVTTHSDRLIRSAEPHRVREMGAKRRRAR